MHVPIIVPVGMPASTAQKKETGKEIYIREKYQHRPNEVTASRANCSVRTIAGSIERIKADHIIRRLIENNLFGIRFSFAH